MVYWNYKDQFLKILFYFQGKIVTFYLSRNLAKHYEKLI